MSAVGLRIITFGCRLNAYESEVMRRHAGNAGMADAVIVNTCAVTAEAERQARQAIRRARRDNPGAPIIVTGCAAQITPDRYAAMPEVDRVLGNAEKLDPASYLDPAPPRVAVNDIMEVREVAAHLIDGFAERTRAFVQVQQGCDHRCTFCIIPFGRGPSRSVPLGQVAEQLRRLVEGGTREVVLTGVDLTSYGRDLPGRPPLGQLVRRLLEAVPEVPRLRLSSLDALEIDPELLDLIGSEPRLMPHLHLSLQSGDDLILKRMKRRHSRAEALALCAEIRRRRPDIALGADLIAGFPTESEAAFARNLALIGEAGISYLHVFPFSARPGTPAARMPQVPAAIRRARAKALRAAGTNARAQFYGRQIGRRVDVLVESENFGHSPHFAPVTLRGRAAAGQIVTARVRAADAGGLIAEVVP